MTLLPIGSSGGTKSSSAQSTSSHMPGASRGQKRRRSRISRSCGSGGVAKLVEKSAGNFKNIIANRVANLSNRKMKISHLTFGIHLVSNNYSMARLVDILLLERLRAKKFVYIFFYVYLTIISVKMSSVVPLILGS